MNLLERAVANLSGFGTIEYSAPFTGISSKSDLNGKVAKKSKITVQKAVYSTVKKREQKNGNEKYLTARSSRESFVEQIAGSLYQHKKTETKYLKCFAVRTLESAYINLQTGEQIPWEELANHLTPSALKKAEQAKENKALKAAGEAVGIPERLFKLENIQQITANGFTLTVNK